jgi:hypothetical protein
MSDVAEPSTKGSYVDFDQPADFSVRLLLVFVVVVDNLDWEQAAAVLSLTPRQVQRSIQELESWLGRYLFRREAWGFELAEPDGDAFLDFAVKMLVDLEDFLPDEAERFSVDSAGASPLRAINLSDFEALEYVYENESFKVQDGEAKSMADRRRRSIKKLERVYSKKILASRSKIEMTKFGEDLMNSAVELSRTLKVKHKAPAVVSYQSDPEEIYAIKRFNELWEIELKSTLQKLLVKKVKNPRDTIWIEEIKTVLSSSDQIRKVVDQYGWCNTLINPVTLKTPDVQDSDPLSGCQTQWTVHKARVLMLAERPIVGVPENLQS